MAAMATGTAAVEGTDSNQPKGAAEEMTAEATVMLAETTTAMEMATMIVRITMPRPMLTTAHQ
jgi:hypothetical protein